MSWCHEDQAVELVQRACPVQCRRNLACEALFVGPMQILARFYRVASRHRALAGPARPLRTQFVRPVMNIRRYQLLPGVEPLLSGAPLHDARPPAIGDHIPRPRMIPRLPSGEIGARISAKGVEELMQIRTRTVGLRYCGTP